ncbi:muropeptide transporter [Mannheimia haemolytica]|uniref:Muropeptide transporter n=1 Tax=Mannheimia haemolytica TaxID=75985 RepID=A0A378MWH4_MANHA|nr:muropeptide transporter [Mannheimia haemolytica]
MGFTKSHIAGIVKITSLWCSIGGGIIGGVAMLKLGVNRALWLFGFVQLITILGFAYLASFEHFPTESIGAAELWKLGLVMAGEYLGVGLGTALSLPLWLVKLIPLTLQCSSPFSPALLPYQAKC